MSANTKIEWADHTFNPWIGCTKVSPGCDNCYAKAEWDDRRHRAVWGAGQPRSRTKNWGDPVKWNKQHEVFYAKHGRRQRVFCASLADVFDNEVPPSWRADLFDLIEKTPNLDWLLLTKRIGNVPAMMIDVARALFWMDHLDQVRVLPNVCIGATICNQPEADRDIIKLLQVPAAKRFLSMEPLLGPVDLLRVRESTGHTFNALSKKVGIAFRGVGIDWVIVGGESGPGARPMHPDWAASLRKQCESAGVAFLFKQWGEWMPESAMTHAQRMRDCGQYECLFTKVDGSTHWIDKDDHTPFDASDVRMVKVGKKASGRLLDGRTWDEVPTC